MSDNYFPLVSCLRTKRTPNAVGIDAQPSSYEVELGFWER